MIKVDEKERAICYSKAASQTTHPHPSFLGPRGMDVEMFWRWPWYKNSNNFHWGSPDLVRLWRLLSAVWPSEGWMGSILWENSFDHSALQCHPENFTHVPTLSLCESAWFETVDPGFEMSMNMHDDKPLLFNVDPQTDVLQQSDAPTLFNLPVFNQGEQPDWRQLKAVWQSNTLSHPHSFNNTIVAPEWSHNQGLEDHLYNQFGFPPLNHQLSCSDEALSWDKVSKTLGDTIHTVEHHNHSYIRAFVTYMIQNHTDIRALWLCCAFDLLTDAKHPFKNASSLKARLVNDNGQCTVGNKTVRMFFSFNKITWYWL